MGPKKDTKASQDLKKDTVEESAAVESMELSLEDTVERAVRRAMESANTELRNEIGNLRKEIVDLRLLIKSSMESVLTDVRTLVEDRVSPIEEKVRDLENAASILSDQVSSNHVTLNSISSDLSNLNHDSLMSEINSIRALANNSMIHSNENEQYSRRNNLRFRGLEQRDGMTSSDMILDFLHSDLGLGDITANDIITAHPLPPSKRSLNTSGASSSNPAVQIPTMLVKFRNRSIKDSVIRKRSILKGKKILNRWGSDWHECSADEQVA